MKLPTNRYTQLIEKVFFKYYQEGETEIAFEREDIVRAARQLKIKLPKNIGDVIYSFRYRAAMPQSLQAKAPKGQEWIIRPKGRSSYAFVASVMTIITPNKAMVEIKIPDATPGVISKYSLTDEQSLLAKLRYNRLIDIFTGVTCYSLQSHLRTSVHKLGQVETDEIYIGSIAKAHITFFQFRRRAAKTKLESFKLSKISHYVKQNFLCSFVAP